ncbi:hypothetical protein L914_12752 [Phytophthora nicotianae]|uniref:Uncharacterized protein n=1 Tax=Phytophthora nicotianae TaxID=4792 RepID=W2MYI0_PHYNI|nr:hypothetical protein L914_12752 [Phytophthora nicotianae]
MEEDRKAKLPYLLQVANAIGHEAQLYKVAAAVDSFYILVNAKRFRHLGATL